MYTHDQGPNCGDFEGVEHRMTGHVAGQLVNLAVFVMQLASTARAPLEYFREAGDAPDPRIAEAVDWLRTKQQAEGVWLLENTNRGDFWFALEEGDNRPSRWNTLRALRVLAWCGVFSRMVR